MDKDKRLTKRDIQSILSDRNIFHSVPDPLHDSSRFVLDSLSIFWFSHRLVEGWGIHLNLDDWNWDEIYGIDKLWEVAIKDQVRL